MREDLNRLIEERGLDALVVTGSGRNNPPMTYMTHGANISQGIVVQKRDQEPVLFCSPIERDEAAASGLTVVNLNKYDFQGILQDKGDRLAATVELYRRIFADVGLSGRVGFCGKADQGRAWLLLNTLNVQLEHITVHGDFETTPIDEARATKDQDEAERIREVGRKTSTIVERTVDFLRSHAVGDDTLLQSDGTSLTIGRVHTEISRFIAEERLEDPEGFIFAIGRDAGVPHSKGRPEQLVRLGKTIVFDIFPQEAGGGYFFDLTRTFCLGYAPPEIEEAYSAVRSCTEMLLGAYQVGQETRHYQRMACEFFEDRGHPTIGTDTTVEEGYVHSIGHGVGLSIHEEPRFSDTPANTAVILPGHVFTCEPGLYYPDQGYGIRIEDVVWIDEHGAACNLTRFPKELVISL